MSLPQKLSLPLMQTQWAAQIDPVLANLLVNGLILPPYKLAIGSNVVNHLLSRQMTGWIIVDQDSGASIYRSQPFNSKTLTLTSDAVATIVLWVF